MLHAEELFPHFQGRQVHIGPRLKFQGHHGPVFFRRRKKVSEMSHRPHGFFHGFGDQPFHFRRRHATPHIDKHRHVPIGHVRHQFHGQLQEAAAPNTPRAVKITPRVTGRVMANNGNRRATNKTVSPKRAKWASWVGFIFQRPRWDFPLEEFPTSGIIEDR
jgi:hypothetical protein